MSAVLKQADFIEQLRAQFPILGRQINGKPLIYLDSANTAQKPQAVLDTLEDFYRQHNANVARAVHTLGEEATSAYEAVRAKIAALINVPDPQQMVYTRGTTEAINLVARSYLRPLLQAGDEILFCGTERGQRQLDANLQNEYTLHYLVHGEERARTLYSSWFRRLYPGC